MRPPPTKPDASRRRSLVDSSAMSFGEHLEDLRKRVLWALAGLVPILVAWCLIAGRVLDFLIAPVLQQLRAADQAGVLQSTGLLETFMAYMKIAAVGTILCGSPWLLYQAWLFVAPGLYRHERRFVYFLLPFSTILTVASGLFLYYAMLPAVLAFFVGFGVSVSQPTTPTVALAPDQVLPTAPMLAGDPANPPIGSYWFNTDLNELRFARASPDGKTIDIVMAPMTKSTSIQQVYRVSEYINTIFGMALALAAGFQTPVVVLLLGWVGIVDRKWLTKYRKHALFVCAIASAVLTPTPDPLTMMVLMVPLYLLYELGAFLLKVLPADRIAGAPAAGEPADAGDE